MVRTQGVRLCVGLPFTTVQAPAASFIFYGCSLAGSLIGGISGTWEKLDYCAADNITVDVEMIAIRDISKAHGRMEKSDVKYRYVIDLATRW